MMACRSSMYIFRDLMKVNSLIPTYLSLFCNFFTFLAVFLYFLELVMKLTSLSLRDVFRLSFLI